MLRMDEHKARRDLKAVIGGVIKNVLRDRS